MSSHFLKVKTFLLETEMIIKQWNKDGIFISPSLFVQSDVLSWFWRIIQARTMKFIIRFECNNLHMYIMDQHFHTHYTALTLHRYLTSNKMFYEFQVFLYISIFTRCDLTHKILISKPNNFFLNSQLHPFWLWFYEK